MGSPPDFSSVIRTIINRLARLHHGKLRTHPRRRQLGTWDRGLWESQAGINIESKHRERSNMRSTRRGAAFTAQFQPDRFKPYRAPQVNVISVPCPVCKAEVGERCTGVSNRHLPRQKMAIRALNQARRLTSA